jgi:X-Pro dipeptidyl-peptidase
MSVQFFIFFLFLSLTNAWAFDPSIVSQIVYVESPTDTDNDGKLDLIYASIDRPVINQKLSTIYTISPYAMGGNEDASNHSVDSEILPQDEGLFQSMPSFNKIFSSFQYKHFHNHSLTEQINATKYAQVRAHSLGTGKSSGCPTVGDQSEILAAKSVIDWLNGKAKAFSQDGKEVRADWANGKVGMIGTSYDGTLPIMVATTGVEGLKAIIPIAAISNWYDYYRANGLVVNPGGYIGEDVDVLGYYIVRRGTCKGQLEKITKAMGREHGDFSSFWQDRDHLSKVKNIKAATFIIHGQADWNVKQKHAIQLWSGLEGVVSRRMFLHRGGHGSTSKFGVPKKIEDWFDHFLLDEENGITKGPQVEVELPDGSLVTQEEWPHEDSETERFYFSENSSLSAVSNKDLSLSISDLGQSIKIEELLLGPEEKKEGRLVFITSSFDRSKLLTGTAEIHLNLSVLNRKAANITVALIEYTKNGNGRIITRGWADPQNYRNLSQGEFLIPGQSYQLSFPLEPKEYRIASGSRLGVLIASTDYDFTLRPKKGSKIKFNFSKNSFIDLEFAP